VKNIRAALCMTPEQAELSRQHNDSNILVLAGRLTGEETAKEILGKWLSAEFEGGRHERRITKIHDLTGK
jgi:ribose 5-phosphate isomerase B